jgi:quinoprotein glucose dehydrogenase
MRFHSAALGITLVFATIPSVFGQEKAGSANEWPMYLHDLAGSRFSPLTQINTENVGKLAKSWSYKLMPAGGIPNPLSPSEVFHEVTPIVVNGVMYLPAGNRVVALEPDTGKEIWSYVLAIGLASQRGVAYWPGDKDNPPRIIFTTGHKMLALNARTGKIDPGFGKEGEIPLEVPFSGVPTIFRNVLLIGTNFYGPGERHIGPQLDQAGGQIADSRAFDARTGKLLWQFHNIPHPGEKGNETWLNDSWKNRTGNNVWAFAMTVDEQRGILYMPVSEPGANFYGGDRPGDNLFGDSVVAVDANTGKLKWYFQTVHHELWDYNLPPAPGLIDIVKDGKKIPALAQVGKIGYMFILDRVTGKPVFGVEERPVPKGNVPGEAYSPTQPFPVKPPPIARVSFTKDDIVTAQDTTPEHAKACQDLYEKGQFTNSGPYTPWPYHTEGSTTKAAIIFPGFDGGVNWGGTAVDPKQNYIFIETKDSPVIGWLEKNPKYTPGNPEGLVEYIRTGPSGLGQFTAQVNDANGAPAGRLPCFKGPWARLVAVNANTGDFAWQVPLGTVPGLPKGKENAGNSTSAGPIATAGGLVFIGAARDSKFRAFDSKTGKELWSDQLEYTATAVPITYQGKNGKQYVAIVAATRGPGAKGGNESLVVYALP